MTVSNQIENNCCICGEPLLETVIFSSSSFSSPDLDLRPSENLRSLINIQINECPNCHYTCESVSNNIPNFNKKVLESDDYLEIVNNKSIPDISRKYLQSAFLYESVNNDYSSAVSYLQAAWTFDDYLRIECADKARLKSAFHFKNYLHDNFDETTALILIDILRRSGEFEQALKLIEDDLSSIDDYFLLEIINFQKKLIKEKDQEVYQISDVVKRFNKEI